MIFKSFPDFGTKDCFLRIKKKKQLLLESKRRRAFFFCLCLMAAFNGGSWVHSAAWETG